jgi:hypothetical protein
LAGGKLYAWGNNDSGQLGLVTTQRCGPGKQAKLCATSPTLVPLEGVTSVAAGFSFSIAAAGGHAYSWGKNKHGQLGNGTRTNQPAPSLVSGLTGVQSVQAGFVSSLATITGNIAPIKISAIPGPDSLTVRWIGTTTKFWDVRWRLAHCCARGTPPFGPLIKLPASVHSYTLAGTQPIEVHVAGVGFGQDVVEGQPLIP